MLPDITLMSMLERDIGSRDDWTHSPLRPTKSAHIWNCPQIQNPDKMLNFAVDPVAPGETLRLYQVSVELVDPETREREIGALAEAMAETGLEMATIVTLSGREDVEVESGSIRVRPAWEWVFRPEGADA